MSNKFKVEVSGVEVEAINVKDRQPNKSGEYFVFYKDDQNKYIKRVCFFDAAGLSWWSMGLYSHRIYNVEFWLDIEILN